MDDACEADFSAGHYITFAVQSFRTALMKDTDQLISKPQSF